MTISYFNNEQIDHMKYLAELKPEEKCWCGWNKLGDCHNKPPYCYPGKTCADKRKSGTLHLDVFFKKDRPVESIKVDLIITSTGLELKGD